MGKLRNHGWAWAIACLVATRQSWAADGAVATFPFRDDSPVAIVQIGKASFHCVIDTGCTVSIFDVRHRAALGTKTKQYRFGSDISSGEAVAYACPDAHVGGLPLGLAHVICLDMGPEIAAEAIDGLLGMDFLIHHCLDLDWDSSVVRISKAVPEALGAQPLRLPLTYNRGVRPQVRFRLNPASETTVGIDTGFNGCIKLSAADEQVVFPRGAARSIPSSCVTVQGPFSCREARLPFFQVGDIQRSGLLCTFHNPAGCDTAVGCDFLREFRAIFDFPHGTLLLLPRQETVIHEAAMAGLSATHSGKKLFVDHVDDDAPASEAGIRVGDEIVSVNGLPASSLRREELRKMFRSGDGKVLRVQLRGRDGERTAEIKLRKRI